jgi:hypothetical protein
VGYAETTQPAMTVPPNAPYGTSTVIRGSVGNTLVGKSYENCMTFAGSNFTATVTLQAEDVAGGTWADLQSFTLSSAYRAFQFTVPSNGARTYRVAVNSSESNPTVYYGSTSQTAQLRSVTRVMSAKFIKPVISLGTQPQAYLWVNPAGQQRAALQWKNPSGIWQGITYKYLYDGKGLVAFAFNRRGTFQFRWYVPGTSTVDGLPVDATYTGPFSLTVN